MEAWVPPVEASVAVAVGVISHVAYFHIGEHHLYPMRYLGVYVALFIASLFIQNHFIHVSTQTSVSNSLSLAAWYFGGLFTSLGVLRILHPLRKFPGPVGCKLSSLWFSTYLVKQDSFRQLAKLHDKYGQFLRIGSNDLSISHPEAVQAIYGLGSPCTKAAWYDLTHPMVSLQSTRDKAVHDRRRRMWSGAFGEKSLRDYEERMASYRALLVRAIDQSGGHSMDMAKWFNLYTFDVMGDLAFGSSFGMLETSTEHESIKLLNSALTPLALMLPMWVFRFATAIPGMTGDWWKFIKYCTTQFETRMSTKQDTRDIMSYLLKPFSHENPTGLDRALLEGDAQLIVVAGSDTTSATLTNIFKFLSQHPQHVDMVRNEIAELTRSKLGDYNNTDLVDLKHLNAVINETMRLYPPVPSALQRLTPPEGLTIDGTFIPGNVTVFCPQYAVCRNPESFVHAEEFIPERWYSRPDLMSSTTGFAPFSMGSYGCIGRPLALLNLRTTVARILADYDVQVPAGTSLSDYENGMTEHFTLAPPPLKLSFTKRESKV